MYAKRNLVTIAWYTYTLREKYTYTIYVWKSCKIYNIQYTNVYQIYYIIYKYIIYCPALYIYIYIYIHWCAKFKHQCTLLKAIKGYCEKYLKNSSVAFTTLRIYVNSSCQQNIQSQLQLGDQQQIEKEKIRFRSPCKIKSLKWSVTLRKRSLHCKQCLPVFS